jgi:hypothetical protein
MPKDNPIGLAELIAKVRQELLNVEQAPDVPLFSVDEVKLELQVTVSKEATGGLNIEVVELGGTVNREDVQTIELTLSPLVNKEQRIALFKEKHPDFWKQIEEKSLTPALNKGQSQNIDQAFGG